MTDMTFYKYQGAGNDFLIADNRDGSIHLSTERIAALCDRRYGIGADGVMLLESSSRYDFRMTYYNSDGSGGMMWSSPCIYVKLRDDAYLMSWVEETCNGMQGTFVFNPNIMHDAGFFYGIGDGGLKLTSFGAYARHCGDFDILKYFDQKNR